MSAASTPGFRKPGLESLPDELILEILESYISPTLGPCEITLPFPNRLRVGYLARLCLVSRKLNTIATPLLYNTIEIQQSRWSPDDTLETIDTYSKKLLGILHHNPELGAYVRTIRGLRGERDVIQNFFYPFSDFPVTPNSFFVLAHAMGLPVSEIFDRIRYHDDVLLALIASLAPGLECLLVDVPSYGFRNGSASLILERLAQAALRIAPSDMCGFRNLRKLRLDLWDPTHPSLDPNPWAHVMATYTPVDPESGICWSVCYLVPLLSLPCLEELTFVHWTLDSMEPDIENRNPWNIHLDWPSRSSPVKKLAFINSHVPARLLSNFIMGCKALERLELTSRRETDAEAWFDAISLPILQHRDSLMQLSIGEEIPRKKGTLEWIRDLQKLQDLRVPYHSIIPNNAILELNAVLPSGIMTLDLDLQQDFYDLLAGPGLESFLASVQEACASGQFPHLTNIHLGFECSSLFLPMPLEVKQIKAFQASLHNLGVRLDAWVLFDVAIRSDEPWAEQRSAPTTRKRIRELEEVFTEIAESFGGTLAPCLQACTYTESFLRPKLSREYLGYMRVSPFRSSS